MLPESYPGNVSEGTILGPVIHCGAVLCIGGCVAASLAPTHEVPAVTSPSCENQNDPQPCPVSPGGHTCSRLRIAVAGDDNECHLDACTP